VETLIRKYVMSTIRILFYMVESPRLVCRNSLKENAFILYEHA